MLSSKVFIVDGKTKEFISDFEITSQYHVRCLSSVDGLVYIDIDASLFNVVNNSVLFSVAPTYQFIKIIVATDPNELYLTEIDSQLEDLENLVGESEVIKDKIKDSVTVIEGINKDIINTLNVINNIKTSVDNMYNEVQNYITLSNNLVNTNNQNLIDITAKISEVNSLKTDATEKYNNFITALSEYDSVVLEVTNKLSELNGLKSGITDIAGIITTSEQNTKNYRDLALQYKNEAIAAVEGANINLDGIDTIITQSQALVAQASDYASGIDGAVAICEGAVTTVEGSIGNITTLKNETQTLKNETVSLSNDVHAALLQATNLATGDIINDNTPSTTTVYSSSKIEDIALNVGGNLIRDNEISQTKTYSSTKIEELVASNKFESLIVQGDVNLNDLLHIYDESSATYKKISIEALKPYFSNPNYDFKNLSSVPEVLQNDYLYVYNSGTGVYSKVLASEVIRYVLTSVLYDFYNETYLGAFDGNYGLYRKSIKITTDPINGSFLFNLGITITGNIIGLEVMVRNSVTKEAENIFASYFNGNISGVTMVDASYNELFAYIDYYK